MDAVIVLRDFMAKGGYVLYAILLLAICLWWLILDRYYYFYREHAARVKEVQVIWQRHESWPDEQNGCWGKVYCLIYFLRRQLMPLEMTGQRSVISNPYLHSLAQPILDIWD